MQMARVDTKMLEKLIQPRKLAAQGFLAPKRVSVTLGTDHTGDDAYFVYLVYADDTPDSVFEWDKLKDMVHWTRARIWKADGEQRWPYVGVKREGEMPY
jgi:hypothetical protein